MDEKAIQFLAGSLLELPFPPFNPLEGSQTVDVMIDLPLHYPLPRHLVISSPLILQH